MPNTKQTKPIKPQSRKNKKSKPIPLIPGKIRLTNIRGARRILSKLIAGFINNEIWDTNARTLTYLLSSYVAMTRDSDIESRLTELETIIEKEKCN
jgi:hypothetical protein